MDNNKFSSVSVVIPTHNRKEKLKRLIESVEKSDYSNTEITVIDDASTDGAYEEIKKRFPEVKIVRNKEKRLVAACRNIGIGNSNGKFIFFIDDDNVIDKLCINELVKTFLSDDKVGVAAPIMYYCNPYKMVWCAGVRRSMITSKTSIMGRGKIDQGQFNDVLDSDDFPNAFMVRSEITKEEVILFDEKNFPWMYEEADFCYRIRKNGWKVVLVPTAKIWHDVPEEKLTCRWTKVRTYYMGRNRVLFHKKYSRRCDCLIFATVFLPIFTLAYVFLILRDRFLERRFSEGIRMSTFYIKGVIDGIKSIM